MGAKVPVNNKSARSVIICNICRRPFRNAHAMQTHKTKVHSTGRLRALLTKNVKTTTVSKADIANIALKAQKPKRVIKASEKVTQDDPSTSNQLESSKPSTEPPNQFSTVAAVDSENSDLSPTKASDTIKIFMFKCPKCIETFESSCQAHRHIQEHHCVNKFGQIVDKDSRDLIKPIAVPQWKNCQEEIKTKITQHLNSGDTRDQAPKTTLPQCKTCGGDLEPHKIHVCSKLIQRFNLSQTRNLKHYCLGCDAEPQNEKCFNLHVPSLHSDEVESLFFKTYSEFTKWKQETELETKTKYEKSVLNEHKQFYRCTEKTHSQVDQLVRACPSSIIIQEYPSGLQVHYYKNHFGHKSEVYTLKDKFKSNIVSNFLNTSVTASTAEKGNETKPNNLYIDFKALMYDITEAAKHINIRNMAVLYGKALAMSQVLNRKLVNSEDVKAYADDLMLVPREYIDRLGIKLDQKITEIKPSKRLNKQYNVPFVKNAIIQNPDEIKKIDDVRTSVRLKRKHLVSDEFTPIFKAPSKRNKRSETYPHSERDTTPEVEFCEVTTNATIENNVEHSTPKIVNSFSLTEEKAMEYLKVTDETLTDIKIEKDSIENSDTFENNNVNENLVNKSINSTNANSPSTDWYTKSNSFTFNDTYRDFVEKNFHTSVPKADKKKERFRTKLGQFKPTSPPKRRSTIVDIAITPNQFYKSSKHESFQIKSENKTNTQKNITPIDKPLLSTSPKPYINNNMNSFVSQISTNNQMKLMEITPQFTTNKSKSNITITTSDSVNLRATTPTFVTTKKFAASTKTNSMSKTGKKYKPKNPYKSRKTKFSKPTKRSRTVNKTAIENKAVTEIKTPTSNKLVLGKKIDTSNKSMTDNKFLKQNKTSTNSTIDTPMKTDSKKTSKILDKPKIKGSTKNNGLALKVDRYEVKEQENDCNILILKL